MLIGNKHLINIILRKAKLSGCQKVIYKKVQQAPQQLFSMEATMKMFQKTQTAALYYLLHTGFQAFKARIKDELTSTSGINLDDIMDDSNLYAYYQQGESADFVAACIAANC